MDPKVVSKRPQNTAFKQQNLPSWQPVLSPPYVITCFLSLGVLFLILGGVVVAASDSIVEVDLRYDQIAACPFEQRLARLNYACPEVIVDIPITKRMKQPVFLYYRLENFFQNHRRYAKSRSDDQLSGLEVSADGVLDCAPLRAPGEYTSLNGLPRGTRDTGGSTIDLSSTIYSPCGLIAWSLFNDSFQLWKSEPNGINKTLICDGEMFDVAGNKLLPTMNCEKKGIAWRSDPGVRFSAPFQGHRELTNKGWQAACNVSSNTTIWNEFVCNGWYIGEKGHKIPSAQDEDLMVWMRLASMSTFRKLYRRVTTDIEPGAYELRILQRYDVRSFGGKKSFVLTTTSWIGGKNYFLGALYLAMGVILAVLGIGFLVKHVASPRRAVLL